MTQFKPNMYDLCKVLQVVEDLENHPSIRRHHKHPNYYQIWKRLPFDVETTVSYLRLAEKLGFVEGYGGFYNGGRGGGSKRWRLIRYPNSIELIWGLDQ